jgi:hypothetical protein
MENITSIRAQMRERAQAFGDVINLRASLATARTKQAVIRGSEPRPASSHPVRTMGT